MRATKYWEARVNKIPGVKRKRHIRRQELMKYYETKYNNILEDKSNETPGDISK